MIVDYEPLDAIVAPEDAFADDAGLIFEHHGSNVAISSTDPRNDSIFADADVVVRGRYVNQRIAVAPMEPHAAAAEMADDGRLTFYPSTQMPHLVHAQLSGALGLSRKQVHVITPHVGGGFGGKAGLYPEQVVVGKAAMTLGRPVIWAATRTEDMATLSHSRAQIQYVELGCKRDGTFTGLRVHLVGDAGAYPGIGAFLPAGTRRMSNGTYRFPAIQFDVAVAVTNTTPTGAYRGAGRPEATALLERAVDHAALELGIDPIELRRTNLLTDDVFPFKTLTGVTYDTGRYSFPLDEAARFVGYEDLRAEQRARRERGDRTLLGIGVSAYVEITAGGGAKEYGAVEIHPDGSATVKAGTSAHGQGHQTAFAMIVSSRTGIPVEDIRLVQSDTDLVRSGGGTGGSRSLQLGGSAVLNATDAMVDKAKHLAAHLLEADVDDIVVDTDAGTVGVAGVPASALDWGALAAAAADAPEGVDRPRRRHARPRRPARLRPGRRDVPVRRAHRRRRGRQRDRQGHAPAPRRRRRLRHRAQPPARRGPAARRCRRRRQPGALRAGRLRRDRQPDHRQLRRLRHPLGRRVPVLRGAQHRDADAAQPARRQGHRRGQHHRLAPRPCRTR